MKADSQTFSPGDITTGEENLLEKLCKEKKKRGNGVCSLEEKRKELIKDKGSSSQAEKLRRGPIKEAPRTVRLDSQHLPWIKATQL